VASTSLPTDKSNGESHHRHGWRNNGRTRLGSYAGAPGRGSRRHGGGLVSYPSQWNALTALTSNGHANGNGHGLGSAGAASCALCGIELGTEEMVPDGGHACADVRWYCKDASACTERWTARLTRSTGAPGGV
jgi:hypothetical protein